jgi:hypothetical protein
VSRLRALVLVLPTALMAVGLNACQSTQSRSAELEKEGATVLASEPGLQIDQRSREVEVVSKQLLTDPYGTAVVVRLRNGSDRNLVNVPILVEVFDAKKREVYSNDVPGIEGALAAVPFIPAGGEVYWVNDQVLATGTPKSVDIKVGTSDETYSGPQPDIEVGTPTIEGDPVSGIEAAGKVVNDTGEDQERLLLYAVATKGRKVVAAGRGAIEHMKPTSKPQNYDIFFIGDPQGADVEVTHFPTLPGFKAE